MEQGETDDRAATLNRTGAESERADGLVERTILVLEAVANSSAPVGPRGLARDLGIERSTISRILIRLESCRILDRDAGGYVSGSRLMALVRVLSSTDTLTGAVREILGELVARFDETCYVCTLSGDVAAYTHEVPSSQRIRFVGELGRPIPLHAGAAGRAILAGVSMERAIELIGTAPLEAFTPNTIVDSSALLSQLERDRERGFSASREELAPGGLAIASPFFDRRGNCQGSVVFSAPMIRVREDQIDDIGLAVLEAAVSLTRRVSSVAP